MRVCVCRWALLPPLLLLPLPMLAGHFWERLLLLSAPSPAPALKSAAPLLLLPLTHPLSNPLQPNVKPTEIRDSLGIIK